MASIYSRHDKYLGDLVVTQPVVKSTPEAANLLVKMDIARQVEKKTANQWRYAAVVLSGAVLYLTFFKRRR